MSETQRDRKYNKAFTEIKLQTAAKFGVAKTLKAVRASYSYKNVSLQ
jgi:hypothetical protein